LERPVPGSASNIKVKFMSSDNTPSARRIITLAYVGGTYLSDGKIGVVFKEITEDGSLGAERVYQHKGLHHLRVSAVYQVEVDGAEALAWFTEKLGFVKRVDRLRPPRAWALGMNEVDVFSALANPVRREILVQLRRGPRIAGELVLVGEIRRVKKFRHIADGFFRRLATLSENIAQRALVSCGTPTPATMRVVQIEPVPTPTFTASAPTPKLPRHPYQSIQYY
jgi:hypothetical protein